MFGTTRSGASSYAKVGLETGVLAADPHQLITMLFDGALVALSSALVNMKTGQIAAKGMAISKAIAIINDGLRASLDQKAGGAIAVSLDSLYAYMAQRLVESNIQNAPEKIEEVQRLLADLKGAWVQISPRAAAASAAAPTLAANVPLMAPRMNHAGYDAPANQYATLAKA